MINGKLIDKYRTARQANFDEVLLDGVHAFKHALRFGADIIHIAIQSERKEHALNLMKKFGTENELLHLMNNAQIVETEVWKQLSPNPHHTGIMAIAKKPIKNNGVFVGDTVVFIENPNSLFNVGAIIRTVVAAGVRSFAVSGRHNIWHGDCIRTAAGLHFAFDYLNVINITQFEELAKDGGYKICALEIGGKNITKIDLPKKCAFVFGTERDGISQELSDIATMHIELPMRNGVSSLNLASSVTATLFMLK